MSRTITLVALVAAVAAVCAMACGPAGLPQSTSGAAAAAGGGGRSAGGPLRLVPQVGNGYRAEIGAVDVSQDGRLALAASEGGGIEVWDLASYLLLRAIPAAGEQRSGVARFLGAGERLVAARGADVVVVEVASGAIVSTLRAPGASGAVAHLAASADGRVVLAGYAHELVVWDVERPEPRQRIRLAAPLEAMALDRDGKRALSAGRQQGAAARITLWEIASARSARELVGHEGSIAGVSFAHDGSAALSWGDGAALVWDLASGKERRRIEVRGSLRAAALSPDGRRVVGASTEGVFAWDAQSGVEQRHMRAGSNFTAELAFTPDGSRVVAGGSLEPMWINDLEAGTLERKLELGWGEGAESVAIGADGRAVVATRNGLAVWDLQALRLETIAGDKLFRPSSMALTPDGKQALVAGHAAELFSLAGGARAGFRSGSMGVEAVALSPDGALVATAGIMDEQPVRVFAASGGEPLWRGGFDGDETVHAIAFSHDGDELVTLHDQVLTVWDATRGGALRKTAVSQWARALAASPTTDIVALGEGDGVALRSIVTGNIERSLVTAGKARALAFSRDGRSLAVAGAEGVELFDVDSGVRREQLLGAAGPVIALGFSPDGRWLISGTAAGIARVHALDRDGRPSIALAARGKEWLVYSDDGYFDASPDGAGLLAVVQGTRAFRPDQLAYRLNRPDILLGRMGLGSPALVASLESRHERRLAKAGLTAVAVSRGLAVPEARIVSQTARGNELVLELECWDDTSALASYHVSVDGVAVHGMAGKPVDPRGEPQHRLRVEERIALGGGDNAIELSCVNRQGGESLRAHTVAKSQRASKPALYFLGFGVSRYRDRRLDLAYARADAEALGRRFEALAPGYQVHTKVLRDAEVTRDGIRRAKSFLARASVDDIVVLFIAGHGVHARDKARTYYFATHEVDVTKLSQTAAEFELIESLLDGIAARRKLFLMDTCQSGEDAEGLSLMPGEGARGLRVRNVRGLELDGSAPASRPAPALDAPRFLDNDLRRRSGAIVLSSSRGSEPSFEDAALEHGVFTAALLEAFEPRGADRNFDRRLSVDELLGFVSRRVAEATGDRQHPVIDRDNPHLELALPIAD